MCLSKKPITESLDEARQLHRAGEGEGVRAAGGPPGAVPAPAILAAEPYLKLPRFVECHRLAPYKERGTDVNVVLDLMIHVIDIVQTIVGSPIVSIDAIGTTVFSDEVGIADAPHPLPGRLRRQRDGGPRQHEDRAQAAGDRGRHVPVPRPSAEESRGHRSAFPAHTGRGSCPFPSKS